MILRRTEILKEEFHALAAVELCADLLGQGFEAERKNRFIEHYGRPSAPQRFDRLHEHRARFRPERDVVQQCAAGGLEDECRNAKPLSLESVFPEVLRERATLGLGR